MMNCAKSYFLNASHELEKSQRSRNFRVCLGKEDGKVVREVKIMENLGRKTRKKTEMQKKEDFEVELKMKMKLNSGHIAYIV